jgi:hypothetical protein
VAISFSVGLTLAAVFTGASMVLISRTIFVAWLAMVAFLLRGR